MVFQDLKPAKIFLRKTKGPAVVGDFGVCHIDVGGERITLTGGRIFNSIEIENRI